MLTFWFNRSVNFKSRLGEWLDEKGMKEEALMGLMPVLRGEDQDVKAEFGFQVVKKELVSFQVNKQERKMLKLLLLFDKLVDDTLYCDQISKIALLPIEMTKTSHQGSHYLRALRLYWKIIKDKASIVRDRCHVYQQKRSLRTHHLHRTKTQSIVSQLATIEAFFDNVFELAYYLQRPPTSRQSTTGQLQEKQVIDYILLHLLHKLLGLYNCQMMANKHVVHKLKELTQGEVVRFRRSVVKFRENCNRFIVFIKAHEGLKGFQHIHFEEIKVETNEGLLKFIDDFLGSVQADSLQMPLSNLPFNFGKITVQKKIHQGKHAFNPRLTLKTNPNSSSSKKQIPLPTQQSNPFLNWHNNYSHQFPQKQIMTIDLILQIKLQESLTTQEGDSCIDNPSTNRCSYDNRSTNITSNYEICFATRKEYSINVMKRVEFQNLYSRGEVRWNQ